MRTRRQRPPLPWFAESLQRHDRLLTVVLIAVLGITLFSVNLFPSINNDGVEYIAYSQALADHGLVNLGYRQLGYPLVLALERLVSPAVGVEPLLLAAVAQRALLIVAAAYAIWLWRWKALPVLLLVATPSLVAYTDLIMTEGLTISMSLLVACLVSHHLRPATGPSDDGTTSRVPLWTAWAATVIAFLLAVIRFPFAVFGVVPLAIWLASRRRGERGTVYLVMLLSYVVAVGLLGVGMMAENSDELGVASPNVRGERAAYWSAWQVAFTLHPENQSDPSLEAYYDGGSPYFRIWDIEAEDSAYPDQAEALRTARDEMLEQAGMAIWEERAASFLGALSGGRIDELRPRIENILDSDAYSVQDAIHVNDVSRLEGHEVFNERYNEGHTPQAVILSPLLPNVPAPYVASLLTVLLPISLLGVAVLGIRQRQLAFVLTFTVPVLVYSAFLAYRLADAVRFLSTTSVFAIAGLCAVWAARRDVAKSTLWD